MVADVFIDSLFTRPDHVQYWPAFTVRGKYGHAGDVAHVPASGDTPNVYEYCKQESYRARAPGQRVRGPSRALNLLILSLSDLLCFIYTLADSSRIYL